MKRLIISVVLALSLVIGPASAVLAAEDTATVTVTAVPSYVSIAEIGNTAWAINDVAAAGGEVIEIDTDYYANPLGDETAPAGATVAENECFFELDNTSTVIVNIKVDWADFTSDGTSPMTNVNQIGTDIATAPDADSFVAWSWYFGMTYSGKVLAKATGSSNLKDNLAANTDLKWGLEIITQTDPWPEPDTQTATVTVTATSV